MTAKRTMIVVITGVLLACYAKSQTPRLEPEIFIPDGMPITLDVSLDENEHEVTKYNIRCIVGPEVNKVAMIVLTIGPDNNVDAGRVAKLTTAKVSELATVAWASTEDVRRLIVVVERVETSSGVWVLDSEDQQAYLKAIVERGGDALPKARFIKRD